MKRREFLSLALGAALVVPAAKQIAAEERRQNQIEQIRQMQINQAIEYINGTEDERQYIVESVERLIAKWKAQQIKEVAQMLTNYRDILLSLNVIPAEAMR